MIGYFAERAPDGRYVQCHHVALPCELPPQPAHPENTLVPVNGSAQRLARTPTEVLYLIDGAEVWVETAALDDLKLWAITQIDAAGESLRLAVINNMPTQTEEYRQALQQAQAWRAAGWPETEEQPAPPDVVSWAMAKWRNGWTARQAADDILAVAAQWEAIISQIRMLRLLNKEDVRHATDTATVVSIVTDMRADMRKTAQQLNLTLPE